MHINISYFFLDYRVKSGEVSIRYLPIDKMVVYYFTKPLNGTKFGNIRDTFLNVQDG